MRTRTNADTIHNQAELLVATWPGAYRHPVISPERMAAVAAVRSFLSGQTTSFSDAAYLLLELSAPSARGGTTPGNWHGNLAA